MKRKLFLPFFLLFLIGLALPLGINWTIFNDSIEKDLKDSTEREVRLLTEIFIEEAEISKASAIQVLDTISSNDIRATLITSEGKVIYDSQVAEKDLVNVENHINRPEVQSAMKFGIGSSSRSSATVGIDLLYVAQQIEKTAHFPSGYLRLAVPTSKVFGRLDSLMQTVIIIMILVLSAIYIVAYLFDKRWEKSINQIKQVIESTGNGDNLKNQNSLSLPPKEEFKDLSFAVSEMHARVRQQFITINKQHNELEGILNSINAGVMLLDERGHITLLNHAFLTILPENFTGSLDNYSGKLALEVFQNASLEQLIQESLNSDTNFHSVEIEIASKIFQINITKTIIEAEMKEEVQLLLVFHDITQLAKLVKIKRDLVANVSHELRTPLTAIQGYAETLNSMVNNPNADKEKIQQFVQVITKNAKHLDRIVKDLLSLSQVENDQANQINASSLLKDGFTTALEECQPLLDEKKIELVSLMDEEVNLAIDADRLSQVFRNLLENAVRYSDESSKIILKTEIEDNLCTFHVQDFGPGIPQEDLIRVFERFYRVEKHRSNNGNFTTGLGLSLCKHIVEKANGTIYALHHSPALIDTTNIVGATIKFNIPLYK